MPFKIKINEIKIKNGILFNEKSFTQAKKNKIRIDTVSMVNWIDGLKKRRFIFMGSPSFYIYIISFFYTDVNKKTEILSQYIEQI